MAETAKEIAYDAWCDTCQRVTEHVVGRCTETHTPQQQERELWRIEMNRRLAQRRCR
jgi:hypothetical protein